MLNSSIYKHIIAHVILPLLMGGFIYLIFRSEQLIMFKCLDYIGFTNHINNLREAINPIKYYMPNWILYSLPDGLWTYAFTSALIIFGDKNIAWLVLPFALSVGIEFLQYLGLFKGTYDPLDMLFCILGYVLSFVIFNRYKRSYIAF